MSISVRYLNVKNGTVNEFIVGARGVSQTWTTEGNKTNRSVINGGNMKHFGTMRGAGNQVEFVMHQQGTIQMVLTHGMR